MVPWFAVGAAKRVSIMACIYIADYSLSCRRMGLIRTSAGSLGEGGGGGGGGGGREPCAFCQKVCGSVPPWNPITLKLPLLEYIGGLTLTRRN